ncbi:hypothetical protein SAMN04487895_12816 [Paenibacillus sophorae]|uniref:Uncharacterized protein n=1 Tax=Paenibacillus sophorae TaxID=1333845 RepID=A0A1H8VVM7_9BACL|nr:hypothetical protein [Paenibacillus sophorae]QWU15647.1 hypothetical protein KP014_28065 [Paenibacillus sophorae]SEP19333.1 hypothetical protein SAMN04487895_12816 [Paenibacillus sophorae]
MANEAKEHRGSMNASAKGSRYTCRAKRAVKVSFGHCANKRMSSIGMMSVLLIGKTGGDECTGKDAITERDRQ